MRSILFVCRGSVEVGLGHLMRTRTVAEAMNDSARVYVAVLGDEKIAGALLGDDTPYTCVQQDENILAVIDEVDADTVVFDILEFDADIFQQIRQRCHTVSISPIFDQLRHVHLAFSRAALPVHRKLARTPGAPDIRVGLEYATIGEHCRRINTEQYQSNLESESLAVAISMGGADAPNKTLRILETIRHIPAPLLIWVLLGEGYQHSYQQLVACVRATPPLAKGGLGGVHDHHEIILARTESSMWRILSGCSLAILAGGITTYEAAYAGIPSIITLERPEQRYLIQDLVAGGAAMYAGAPLDSALGTLSETLVYLERNREMLLSMHRRGQALLDRDGAERIAEQIVRFDPATNRIPEVLCA